MLTQKELTQYLQRIDYQGSLRCCEDTLSSLQWAHLTHIPYENLNLLAGIPLSLQPADLFRKIITEQRGGYCFELQGLFKELLETLGFSVAQYAGRFLNSDGSIQMRRHRVLVVSIGGERFLVDVGVRRESARKALLLSCNDVQSDGICQYRFIKDPFFGWILQQKEQGKDWKSRFGFTEEPQIDDDFIMPSFYCEQHPDSTFHSFMKLSIFRGKSNFTLVDGIFSEYCNAKVQFSRSVTCKEEVRDLLCNCFLIPHPPCLPLR